MKLFGKFRSCWGTASVKTVVETTRSSTKVQHGKVVRGGSNHETAVRGVGRVKFTETKKSRNWKPKLYEISEDTVVSDYERSDKNLSGKVKAKPKAKGRSPAIGEDYWKSSCMWGSPAYYSAPF